MNGLTQEIYEQIYNVFDGLESNSFETLGKPEVCMFEKPLIGVAAGDDPYYDFLALLKMLGWRILQGFQSLFHFLKKRCFHRLLREYPTDSLL